jgi:hypothetical protein
MEVLMGAPRKWKYLTDIKVALFCKPQGGGDYTLLERAQYVIRNLKLIPSADNVLMGLCAELEHSGEDDSMDAFNDALDKIYEWADVHDVWLGVTPQNGYLNES